MSLKMYPKATNIKPNGILYVQYGRNPMYLFRKNQPRPKEAMIMGFMWNFLNILKMICTINKEYKNQSGVFP